MSIITFLTGLLAAGSGIGAAMENAKLKKDTLVAPNGMKYYYDRKMIARTLNGIPIDIRNDNGYCKIINLNNNRVVYDEQALAQTDANFFNKREKEKNKGERYFVQMFTCYNRPFLTKYMIYDIMEDKAIPYISDCGDGVYRIVYRYDWCVHNNYWDSYKTPCRSIQLLRRHSSKNCEFCLCKEDFFEHQSKDEQVDISKDEYDILLPLQNRCDKLNEEYEKNRRYM